MSVTLIESAKLLRTPKVYNAIITTNENLQPSRAFPVIQPVIQPAVPVLTSYFPASAVNPYSRNDVDVVGAPDYQIKKEKIEFPFLERDASRQKIR